MDNDVSTAATIESLRQQLDAARKDNDFLRGFANNPDVQSMRDALTASQAREEAYRADVVRLTADADELRRGYAFVASENARLVNDVGVIGNRAAMDSEDAERQLSRERSRADVLAEEVLAWRHWNIEDAKVGGDDEVDANANWAWGLLECRKRETDSTNALDPAKFKEHP